MAGSEKACMECAKNCLKAHGKNPSVTTPAASNSFIKIMVGDFEEALFLPSKFAQTFQDMVNKNAHLEDSNGYCWKVTISYVDDRLALHQGWRDFVLDHNIKHGEFVTFKYISTSLLSTQIFGANCCERIHFHGKSNNNKCKRKGNKVPFDGTLNSEKDNRSSKAAKGKCFAGDEDPGKEDCAMEPSFHDLFDDKINGKNRVSNDVSQHTTPAENALLVSSHEKISNVPGAGSGIEAPVKMERDPCQTDDLELVDNKFNSRSKQKASIVVETERKGSIHSPLSDSVTLRFSGTVNSLFWLKLTQKIRLPSFAGRSNLDRRVVMLRDQDMISWPVLYQGSLKFVGFTSGWKKFAVAKNLQKGDQCKFKLVRTLFSLETVFEVRISKAFHAGHEI